MLSHSMRLLVGALITAMPLAANAATISFGPTPYLQHGDTPDGFACDQCVLTIEDFEDNSLDPFLTIDNGDILEPNSMSGLMNSVTDSVDGDDGSVDGNGNGGHSWFTGSDSEADRELTITFSETVKAAGLVFTDGDSSSANIRLEAFDEGGESLGVIDAGDLADHVFTGETEEDRFLGFQNSYGAIKSITLSMDAGIGIEVDHIHWQALSSCVPEPASLGMVLFGMLGLPALRRRRR